MIPLKKHKVFMVMKGSHETCNIVQETSPGKKRKLDALQLSKLSRLSFAANSNLIPLTGSIKYSSPYPAL
jgi:hypothetical protein